jgi:hypothetical protein
MGVSRSIFGSASVLVVSIIVGGGPASAMEPAKVPAASSSPSLSMPSFFDGNRVTDLKDAWRGSAAPASPTGENPAGGPPLPNDDAALAEAKAAMLRAEEAGRDAAAVREKAEELSRRFGAETAPAANDATPTAVSDTSTGSIEPSRADLPPPSALGAPPPADQADAKEPIAEPNSNEVATPEATTSLVAIPDLPAKKDAARAQDTKAKTAAVQAPQTKSKAAVGEGVPSGVKTTPGPSNKADVMPANMGAFGWNSQP